MTPTSSQIETSELARAAQIDRTRESLAIYDKTLELWRASLAAADASIARIEDRLRRISSHSKMDSFAVSTQK